MGTSPDSVETKRSPQGAQIALVVLGVVVLLALVWFFVLRDSGTEVNDALPTPAPAPTEQPAPSPGAPPGGGRRGPVETFEVFAPKDPFKPLVVESTATGTDATDGTGTDGTGTDGTGTNGTGTGTDGTGTNGPGTNGTGTGGGSVGGHTVRLIDAFEDGGRTSVQVEVDGTVYTVGEGETFAENFQLVSVAADCANLLFGDDQFTLCEGEEILK